MKAKWPFVRWTEIFLLILSTAFMSSTPLVSAMYAGTLSPADHGSSAAAKPNQPDTIEGPCAGFQDISTNYYACYQLTYMQNNGWVSGYTGTTCTNNGVGSPCFLPDNNVTRGQFSKIVALSFGVSYSCTPPGCRQDFTDVPWASTFYYFIEAVYIQGWFNGYTGTTCTNNGVGSPCFLPNNPLTRGQMSKITSNAAGYNNTPQSGRQTFYDVPSTQTFYTYIERLVMNITNAPYPPDMSQPYCGSTTQPCFYPDTVAPRIDAVQHVGQAAANKYNGNNINAQVFPHASGFYDSIYSYVTTPKLIPSWDLHVSRAALRGSHPGISLVRTQAAEIVLILL